MSEVLVAHKIAWRRSGVRRHYVGTLCAFDEGIRLTGRDPLTGVEAKLSIPLDEVANVRLSRPGDEQLAGERCVVLELADSGAVLLREVGIGPLNVHLLAESLGALGPRAPRNQVLAEGG